MGWTGDPGLPGCGDCHRVTCSCRQFHPVSILHCVGAFGLSCLGLGVEFRRGLCFVGSRESSAPPGPRQAESPAIGAHRLSGASLPAALLDVADGAEWLAGGSWAPVRGAHSVFCVCRSAGRLGLREEPEQGHAQSSPRTPALSCSQGFLEADYLTYWCSLVHFKEKKKAVLKNLFPFCLTGLGRGSVACKRLSFAMCSICWNLVRSLPGRGGRMEAVAVPSTLGSPGRPRRANLLPSHSEVRPHPCG